MSQPREGFHHPASRRDILETLDQIGPMAFYGLRSVELVRAPMGRRSAASVFGRYCAPGTIRLFEQPTPPWQLPGRLEAETARRWERAGAVLTVRQDSGGTLVEWPGDTLRRFMIEEVLLHELGHHVLQHFKGKRPVRVARTADHEAFAERFAARQRRRLAALRQRTP